MTDHPSATPTWLGPVRQTAYVVDDIEASMQTWLDSHGIGPWFSYEVDLPETDYRGETVRFHAEMALAQSGIQQIELIQPDSSVNSIYNEFLAQGGRGFHHLCYWAELDRATEHFVGRGADVVQSGTTGNGNGFVYVSGDELVPYIEIVDPNGAMARFFETIAAAAVDWDGSDPIRRRG